MAEDAELTNPAEPVQKPRRGPLRRRLLALLVGFVGGIVLVVMVLDSPIGHRFVADRIAQLAPASGLRFSIGRIEGSLFGRAVLRDVTLYDPKGVFARIPEAELDWRPFNWFRSGLDVRKLVGRRGTLLRLPELLPGDPDAPILPNFDIRIDRFEIDGLKVSEDVLGTQRRIDLLSRVDIRDGRALVKVDAKLGGEDRLHVLLDAIPEDDRFDIDADYAAPKGGLLSEVTGIENDMRLRIIGNGNWTKWDGALVARRDDALLAALRLTNRSGRFGFLGQVMPADLLTGVTGRAIGPIVALKGGGTLVDSVLDGDVLAIAAGFRASAKGAIDLDGNAVDQLRIGATVTNPAIVGSDVHLEGASLTATLDGKFRELTSVHSVRVNRLRFGTFGADQLALDGRAYFDGERWKLPMILKAARATTGNAMLDPRLVNPRVTSRLVVEGSRISSDVLAIDIKGASARLTLAGDLAKGGFGVTGPVAARGLALQNLGVANADANIVLGFGKAPWRLDADVSGRMVRVDNATLTSLAGDSIRFSARVSTGEGRPLLFERAKLDASKLSLAISGKRLPDGRATITGGGRHTDFGPFTIDASMAGDGLRAELVLANPLPAAGLRDVRVALAPIADGFRIETNGGSTLGAFDGVVNLFMRPSEATRLDIERFDIASTSLSGALTFGDGAMSGDLQLAGGGVTGSLALAPREGGQGFDLDLTADDASFEGQTPISVGSARVKASGYWAEGGFTVDGTADGRAIGYGDVHISTLAAKAQVVNGRGNASAAVAGRSGSRFNLQLVGDFEPKRVSVVARGNVAGRRLLMPRRAVLTDEEEGWRLAPTQINFGNGKVIASGMLGETTALDFAMVATPLSLTDFLIPDLGFGGTISGLVQYRATPQSPPTGSVRVMVEDLTRSGLVLTSRPMDVALVARLSGDALDARAVAREDGGASGKFQARIANLPAEGSLSDRLGTGNLFAQLRYDGSADTLWRLAAVEAFDVSGSVTAAADVTGTLRQPVIRGSLSGSDLRLQSALTGTDISDVALRGRFAGSRLELTSFSGKASNGGRVTGSGMVDFAHLFSRGPALDLRIAADNASILARSDMAATVTGPLRIVSDGRRGTIAGRVNINRATWKLGHAVEQARLPSIKTREINGFDTTAPRDSTAATWRYMIDAAGNNRINVSGLGLDSEWSANIRLRGTVDEPAISGVADLLRGNYTFAGKRFDITRGRITFNGSSPPDPMLDIHAEAEETGLTARVAISGTASMPDITFSSVPAMPEEELLSRLLFGSSVADISPAEALQLGAALAAFGEGGGGMLDPVNQLRSAIGLDRLRIVGADAATGQDTSIAAGMYLGRRLYVEIVTDGRGYSATQLEFRITNWLSLLASVSTIGRESVNLKASKDY